jgi:hypothetical protein
LPRGNQEVVAQLIARRGLTTRQATQLVDRVLAAPDDRARGVVLAEAEHAAPATTPGARARRTPLTPAEAIVADAAAVSSRAARLHARLLERPLVSLGAAAEQLVAGKLGELRGVIGALHRTLGEIAEARAEVPRVA